MLSNRIFVSLVILLSQFLASGSTWAQSFPVKPITILVGYAAGGSTDVMARIYADAMAEELGGGQRIVIENRPGASGAIAAKAVMDAKPDGYLLHALTTGTVSVPLFLKAYENFNIVSGFSSISYLAYSPGIMMVPASSPARNLKEFIEYAKKSNGKLNVGNTGGSTYLNLTLWFSMAGAKVEMITYKGSAPNMIALSTGETDFAYDVPSAAKPFIDSGKVRPIAVLTDKPWPGNPSLPLASEVAPGYVATPGWWGLNGPPGLPKDIVAKLSSASRAAVNRPAVRKRLLDLAVYVDDGGPEVLDRAIKSAFETWKKGAEITGLKPQ